VGDLQDAAKPSPSRTPTQQKIGDFFDACMDVDAVEKAGSAPIAADLQKIADMKSIGELGRLLGGFHAKVPSSGLFFGKRGGAGREESSQQIMAIYSGGLGLPDRDYYVKDDDKSKETRAKYVEHVAKMLELTGDTPEAAKAGAAAVLRIETALAKHRSHGSNGATPTRSTIAPPGEAQDDRSRGSTGTATSRPSAGARGLAERLAARVSHRGRRPAQSRAARRSEDLPPLGVRERQCRFSLEGLHRRALRVLSRVPPRGEEAQPRWKKCVGWVDGELGEALGKEFTDRAFPPTTKAKTVAMTNLIVAAMKQRIQGLDWMSPKTKAQALEKLTKIRNKVGYPDVWRDYGSLSVKRGDFFGNVMRANLFENKRQLAKIGKPVDRGEWGMTPPTVNAYYNPSMNDINFPAGVLMPPLYDTRLDDAPNYGNTGSTIGHELTHGFDDEGRQFDGDGNLRDWWTKQDADEFEKRATCVRDQYSGYVIVDDIKITGKLTSGEDIADLGGTILAWAAWKEATKSMTLAPADGLTPEQRFFVGLAQWACENQEAGKPPGQRGDQPALPRPLPHQRRRREHARVRERVPVQGGRGAREETRIGL
jgi:endothelin-converting enzyme/putative endopeptidase